MSDPEKTHGLLGEFVRPMLLKNSEILLYQCNGDRTRPYKVFFNFQRVLGRDNGQPLGGRITTVSSSGKRPLQNAFLTSPWRRTRLFLIAKESRYRN